VFAIGLRGVRKFEVCDQFASCTEVRIMGVGGWGVVVVTESEVQVVKPYG